MKKSMLVVLVMALMTLMANSSGLADVTGRADTSKEGSLLIWPLVQTNDGNETYIFITNSDAGGEWKDDNGDLVSIKCYWEVRPDEYDGSGNSCPISDAVFYLSFGNPLIFKASDGTNLNGDGVVPGIGEGMKGMLKCWAIDPTDTNQISWNHLSGYAIIIAPEQTAPGVDKDSAWKYSAWRFAANVVEDANGTIFADGFWVGKNILGNDPFNTLRLWGANRVITSTATSAPVCPPGGGVDCCPSTTFGIKMGRTFNPTVYTYYCVQKVNSSKCQFPYSAPACDKQGGAYDACPSYLLFDFLAEPSDGNGNGDGHARNYLALAPCKEDLRSEDGAPGEFDFHTRLLFSVWNANEVKKTGHYSCAHCNGERGTNGSTYDIYLSDLKVGGINYFQEKNLGTNSGRFRVEGKAGGKCKGATATPLIGIMGSRLIKPGSEDLVGTIGTGAGAAVNTVSANGNGGVKNSDPAWIKWDPAGDVYEKKER